jgi:hypothetical protein
VLFYVVEEVTVVVGHCDVQVLGLFFVGVVAAKYTHNEVAPQHVYDLDFSVFVFGVLENFFDCNDLSCSFYDAFVDFPEGALSDDFK